MIQLNVDSVQINNGVSQLCCVWSINVDYLLDHLHHIYRKQIITDVAFVKLTRISCDFIQ